MRMYCGRGSTHVLTVGFVWDLEISTLSSSWKAAMEALARLKARRSGASCDVAAWPLDQQVGISEGVSEVICRVCIPIAQRSICSGKCLRSYCPPTARRLLAGI